MKTISKIVYGFVIALLMFSYQSCVTEYDPKNLNNVGGLLVVEGTISDNVTVVKLSRSVGLGESIDDVKMVGNASMYIECSDGTLMQEMSYEGNGTYSIETPTLHPDKQYRLCISLEGDEYLSEFLAPITTPEIDALEVMKEERKAPVHVYVSTHDDSDSPSRYYRWSYIEHWEIKASHNANAYYAGVDENGQEVILPYDQYPNPYYYCWGKDSSTSLIIESTAKLSEDKIVRKELKTMSYDDRRLSVLYYIKVAQNKIRKEAYDYFLNMKKNVEDAGGLFSQMPTEMKGNIQCITNPALNVVGYIDVSTTTYVERFFPVLESELYEESQELFKKCLQADPESQYPVTWLLCEEGCARIINGVVWYIIDYSVIEERIYSLALHLECIDCRLSGTKEKPSFWPNDHY